VGGLGAPLTLYLAAAGVGHLTLIDGDEVDLSNLQRQVLYTEADVGKHKVIAAKHRLGALNSAINIDTIQQHFSPEIAASLARGQHSDSGRPIDLVIDCTDNFPTRYLINDFCVQIQSPWIYASVYRSAGQCAVFLPGEACFRCIFPEPALDAEDCNSAGILGVLPGILGLFQSNEALKLLAGHTSPLQNHLMLFDAQGVSLQKIALSLAPDCTCRSDNFTIAADNRDYQFQCVTSPEHETLISTQPALVSPKEFESLKNSDAIICLDVRSHEEHQGFNLGGELMPLDTLAQQHHTLRKDVRYLCYCQSGKRSLDAAAMLQAAGFDAVSLSGGILAWLRTLYSQLNQQAR